MIALPKKLYCAIEAVLYIAYNARSMPVSSKEIAEYQGLPPRYLEQLMQRLVHADILRGIRGPRGGYVLAKERRRITVGEICQALHDTQDDEYGESALGKKVVQPLWQATEEQLLMCLRDVNMAELCGQAMDQQIQKTTKEKLDFAI